MEIGEVVVPIDNAPLLRSGSWLHDCAIVVSTDPFVIVSPEADMIWYNQKPESFKSLCPVHPEILKTCMVRYITDKKRR